MPTLPTNLFRAFVITVLRANGTGVAGALVRILNNVGTDVTTTLLGGIPAITNESGFLVKNFPVGLGLPAGTYTIQVLATGFDMWSFTTVGTFIGQGDFTANLTRPGVHTDYTLTPPPAAPLSAMTPIIASVASPNAFPWEFIRATVSQDNHTTAIESPVDVTGLATLDIRNRIRLGIRPLLVADGSITRPDTDFSTVAEVSLSSVSDGGEATLPDTFTVLVAQTLPPDNDTDLSAYVSRNEQDWMVPAQPVIAFRGYYRDVMVWLTVPSLPGYVLTTTYYNGAGTLVSTTTDNLTGSDSVQRIRLNTDPNEAFVRAVLLITSGASAITKPLTVLYRD